MSYHPETFSNVPSTTFVLFASRMHEAGLPMKSEETSSSSVYSMIPFIGPLAAARKASLICWTVTGFSTTTARSVSETSGVGTRMAMPSIFPLSSGMTREVAFAAPVVVGMIESAAARARRRSLCGRSSTF